MSSEDPFTSVNWDRGDNVSIENEGNAERLIVQNPPDVEQNNEHMSLEGSVLDSSSIPSQNLRPNKQYQSQSNLSEVWGGDTNVDRNNDRNDVMNNDRNDDMNDVMNNDHNIALNARDHDISNAFPGKTLSESDYFGQRERGESLEAGNDSIEGTKAKHNEESLSKHTPQVDPNSKERDAISTNTIPQNVSHSQAEDQEISQLEETEGENHSFDPSLLANNVPTQDIRGQHQMEEAFQKYSIVSRVTNPISDRDGNSKLFISYLITTDTDHPELLRLQKANGTTPSLPAMEASEKTTVKIRRRYGDFRFLHDCLVSDFPQLLVPPLPAKSNFKYLTGDTFSTSFVHKRLHSLDRFVRFICQHKLLSQSSVFHYFISDSSEWVSFTKNLKILKGEDGEGSIMGKVVNEDLLTETIMNFFTPSKHKKETNKDILEISDKLKKLYENLVKLDRIFSKLNKKNVDLKHDYESFSTQINKSALLHDSASHAENGTSDANASFASSVDTAQANARGNFKIFSDSLMFFSGNWASLSRYIDESFLVSLKDCAKYIARLSGLIELHHNKKIDLQVLEDYLAKARNDLASIGGYVEGDSNHRVSPPNAALIGQNFGGLVNNTTQLIKDTLSTSATPHIGSSQTEGKKKRLIQKIHDLEDEISAHTQLVTNLTNRIINEEYPNWDRFNKIELKESMSDLCDQEISFYQGLVDNWTDVEAKLVRKLEELT